MKILVVLPSLANKGPIRVAQQLTNTLTNSNISCEVWYFDPIQELSFNCKTRRICFFYDIDTKGFDLIHSHGIRPDAWVAKARILGLKTPSITTIHNYADIDLKFQYNWIVALIFSRIWRFIWRFQTRIVVLSEDARRYYQATISSNKLLVIGNGITEHFPIALPREDKARIIDLKKKYFIFGACAQATKRKGLDQIVLALARNPDCAFALIGDGPELDQLRTLAESHSVSDRCFFAGFRQNARDFLPLFDAVVLPSRSEGFPLAFIEAAAAAQPVLLSDIPIFREIAPEGTASFFRLNNPASLDEAILKLRESSHYLSDRIRALYEQSLTAESMTQKYINCYRSLTNHTLKK